MILSGMAGLAGGIPLGSTSLAGLVDRDAALLIMGLLAIAWLLPNTQQFMRDYMDIDGAPAYRIDKPAPFIRWLRWVPKPVYAITLAALTTFTIISLWQPSEFIYYQF